MEFLIGSDVGFDPGWTWVGQPDFIGYVGEPGSAQGGGGNWIGPDGTLYQDLNTTPGQTYLLSFAAQGFPPGQSWRIVGLQVYWGDQLLVDYALPTTWYWNYYNFVVVASNSVTRLLVSGAGCPSIDNFSVTVVPMTQPQIVLTTNMVYLGPTSEFLLTMTAFPSVAAGRTVSAVDFFEAGANLIGTATNAPYSVTWSNIAAGNYFMSARVTDSAGADTMSGGVNVAVNLSTVVGPPAIFAPPSSRTNNAGTTATFSVVATGTEPLTYQWSWNGTDLSDATNATLTLTNLQISQAGNYAVWVTNALGSILSSNVLLTVNPAPQCVPAPAGLVGWWQGKGNVQDSAGGSDGVVLGNLTYDPGEMGPALNFNGVDAGVQLPAGPTLDAGQGDGLSIEGWIKPTVVDFARPIVEWNNSAGGIGVHLWISQGGIGNGVGCLYANLIDTAGNWHYFSSPAGLVAANSFQHVGLTYDKGSGVAKLFLNGAVVAQQNLGTFIPQTTYDCYLGHRSSGAWWVGAMHEISLYARALADGEIQAIYNANSAGKCAAGIAAWILRQPADRIVLADSSTTLAAAACGTPPLSYRWKKNGLDLFDGGAVSGTTTSTLRFSAVSADDAASYSVFVSNAYGTVLSSNAMLTLIYGSSIVPWGDNTYGQTNVPPGLIDVTAISSGPDSYHALALRANHTVVAWGNNDWGQTNVPAGLTDVIAIAAGGMHSLALQVNGNVVAWGNNDYGQTSVPADLTNVVGIAAGYGHSLALKADGTAVGWGDDSSGQTDAPLGLTNVVALAAGYNHSLALKADGAVVAWGNNDYGQTDVPAGLTNVVAIAAGDSHNLAVRSDGTMVGWGWNGEGETDIPAGLNDAVAIAGGFTHSLALKSDGTVVAWGWDAEGETDVPAELSNVSAITAGYLCSLALVEASSPVILKQPSNVTADYGATVLFSANAVGAAPLSYQWQKNGSSLSDGGNVSGSATASLSLGSVQEADTATYTVIIANAAGSVTSSPAILAVLAPASPRVFSDPAACTNVAGTTVTFTVVASGAWPLSFQWDKNGLVLNDGGSISGATTASLTLSNVQDADAAEYTVVIANALGSATSAPALLTVLDPPTITVQPVSSTNDPGSTAVFTVAMGGTPPFACHWKKDGIALTDGGNVSGASTATLTLTDVQYADTATYTVEIVNLAGSVSSLPAILIVKSPPVITLQPASCTNIVGTTATFTVAATGMAPLSYQWKKDDSDLADSGNVSGATTATLTLTDVQDTDAAAYTVVITNIPGSVTSAPAMLALVHPPTITLQPASRTNTVGTTATFTVIATGTPPLSYQWLKNGIDMNDGGNVSGATGDTLTLGDVRLSDAGEYSVLVNNVVGVASSNAVLSVVPQAEGFLWNVNFEAQGQKVGYAAIGQTTNDFWNVYSRDADGSAGTKSNLKLADGTVTAVQLSVRNGRGVNCTASSDPMYACYIYSGYQTILTITLTNLPVGVYELLAYSCDGYFELSVAGEGDWWRTCYDSAPAGVPVWTEGVQYGRFTNVHVSAGQSLNLVAHPAGPDAYGILAGMQFKQLAPEPPFILQQPTTQTVVAEEAASFTVAADGTAPLNYQWKKNGLDLVDGGNVSGATTPTLTVGAISPTDTASYSVLVSNDYGTVLSSNAMLNLVYGSIIVPWGDNTYGQMNVPPGLICVTAISTGPDSRHNLALGADRTVVAWGNNDWCQTNVPADLTEVVAVAAGGVHSLALRTDGTVVAWGGNSEGETNVPTDLTNAVAIAAGYEHSLAVKADRSVVGWGNNDSGQTDVAADLTNVVAVAAGAMHSLALKANGTVFAWGDDAWGQTDVPAGLTNVAAIAAGDSHNLAVRSDGTVVGWGWNGEGETDIPAGLNNVVEIAAGYEHSLALKSDGTVVAWGWDGEGETDVPAGLSNVMAIAAGETHSLALVNHGSPVILKQPSNVTADYGATVLFSANAVGAAPLSYQWQKNGSSLSDGGNVSGSATASLSLGNVQEADTATYTVVITNTAGSVASSPAILTVLVPRLQIERDGSTLSISWPTQPAGFVLESSGSLCPAEWGPVACAPLQLGDQLEVRIEMSETNCFYRLRFNGP
jgi:alpha-tubulin suppressor-like RCC1 family protein